MIKLLHAADLHLDSPFSGLTPEEASRRRQAQRETLSILPQLCRSEGCDAVLLAGDLFDTERVYTDTLEYLCENLAACQVPVFIAPGNHDPISPASPYNRDIWPANVHIFKSSQIRTVELDGFTISGAAFCGTDKPSLSGFSVPRDDRLHVMVLHGEVNSQETEYRTATPMQVAASRLHYLAMGHIHQRGARKTSTGTTYAWPGCMMGRGFDETGAKGVYLVQVEKTGVQVQFRHLDVPRYEILQMSADQVRAKLPQDAKRHHYRIQLTGICPEPDLAALQRELEGRFASLQLEDLTQRPMVMADAQDDTLAGLFTRDLQTALEQTEDEAEQKKIRLALELGQRILQGREVILP